MKPGDLVLRRGFMIYLYEDPDLKVPAKAWLSDGEIATVVQTIPTRTTIRTGKLISSEKLRLMLNTGLCFWADASHFSLVQTKG